MSEIQVVQNNNNEPFVLSDDAEFESGLTLGATTSAATLTKGCALGEVGFTTTSSALVVGELKAVSGTATDGSQVTKYLLAEDVTTTTSSQSVSGYSKGLFDENQVSFANTATLLTTQVVLSTADGIAASIKDTMRDIGLRLAPGISVSGYENT